MECRVGRSGEEKEKEVSVRGELVEVVEGKQRGIEAEDELRSVKQKRQGKEEIVKMEGQGVEQKEE